MDTAGDGFFATFDGPARAICCALAIEDNVKQLAIEVRAGVHTGECELMGDNNLDAWIPRQVVGAYQRRCRWSRSIARSRPISGWEHTKSVQRRDGSRSLLALRCWPICC
jgi:hypothetical protein